ncbi:MAG: response regulator transcription factor [Chloroflexi bacterium]|nr:response regulator transcription factor [Chloroflexota bacterium]
MNLQPTSQPAARANLVVDVVPGICNSIGFALRQEGYHVLLAGNGQEALEAARAHRPDLVILDLGLPDISGVEVCRRLRRTTTAPVLFLSARREEIDKVTALDAGGDDYVTKPVGTAELAARVRALLRRADVEAGAPAVTQLSVGAVEMDTASHEVRVNGSEVALTPREFELLRVLMEQPGRVAERQTLMDRVWGADWFGGDNVLDVFVRQLRLKIEPDPDHPTYIQTLRGVGYRMVPPA